MPPNPDPHPNPNPNPHQIKARYYTIKLAARIASPLRPAPVFNQEEQVPVRFAISQWRHQIALAKGWLADQYPDPSSIPRILKLDLVELEKDIDALVWIATHQALRILLDTAQLVADNNVETLATVHLEQPHALISDWDRAKAKFLLRLQKQHDLEYLCQGMALFRRLVIRDFYGIMITRIRASIDALNLGVCRIGPHPLYDCPRLRLLGRIERQLLSDLADAVYHLRTRVADPVQLRTRYQTETTTDARLAADRRSEISELLNGMVAQALDCSCDVRMGSASRSKPAVIAQFPKANVQGLRFHFAVLIHHMITSLSLGRSKLQNMAFAWRDNYTTKPFKAAVSNCVWHRLRSVMIGAGFRHAAMLFAAAVLLNASLNILLGDYLGNDPVGDIRVALARPDLFLAESKEMYQASCFTSYVQVASFAITAVTTARKLLAIYSPGSRSCETFETATNLAPFSDLVKLALITSTFAAAQRLFCLAMRQVSLMIAIIIGLNEGSIQLLPMNSSAESLTELSILLPCLVSVMQHTVGIFLAVLAIVLVIFLVLKRRFALPIMMCVAVGCIWYAVGHRSVVYLPLEAANFFVAVAFSALGAFVLFEEFIRDPMRLEARRCLVAMSRDSAFVAYKRSEPLALQYGRERRTLCDAVEAGMAS